jgi:type IV pilus assembly protein PilV
MLNRRQAKGRLQRGTTLVEVLITLLIVAFGILGLAGLISANQVAELEAYQRTQAVMLLQDMTARISANRANAANYVQVSSSAPVIYGTGDSQPADCTTLSSPTLAQTDLCEWSNELKGTNEQISSTGVGMMQGARACITQVQAPNSAAGVCLPGIYQVTVMWQGMRQTSAPANVCQVASSTYGSSAALRRSISTQVSVGLLSCS